MRRRSSGSGGELGPKIVQIETRYVETDPANFRDVVQSLTGKNSSTDWIGRRYNADAVTAASSSSMVAVAGSEIKEGIAVAKPEELGAKTAASNECLLPNSMVMNNVALKDFDSFLLELFASLPDGGDAMVIE